MEGRAGARRPGSPRAWGLAQQQRGARLRGRGASGPESGGVACRAGTASRLWQIQRGLNWRAGAGRREFAPPAGAERPGAVCDGVSRPEERALPWVTDHL